MTEINNLGFAAYLSLQGYELLKPPFKNDKGRFVFVMNVGEEESKNEFYNYSTSKYAEFDSVLVNLKKMLR